VSGGRSNSTRTTRQPRAKQLHAPERAKDVAVRVDIGAGELSQEPSTPIRDAVVKPPRTRIEGPNRPVPTATPAGSDAAPTSTPPDDAAVELAKIAPPALASSGSGGEASDSAAVPFPSADAEAGSHATRPDARRVLDAAPRLFAIARNASGFAAVLFEHIRCHEFYRDAGFASMRAYARASLGISEDSYYRTTARAG